MLCPTRRTGFALAACLAVLAAAPSLSAQSASGSLLLRGPGQRVTLSLGAFRAMHHETIQVMNNHVHARQSYSGVPLVDLLHKVGAPQPADVKGKALSEYVVAIGSDHYQVVLSLAEIEPQFHPGTVLVADEMNGKPLDTKSGPFRLIVSEDHEPARWVHTLVKVELRTAQ